jgi:hypothetical protein
LGFEKIGEWFVRTATSRQGAVPKGRAFRRLTISSLNWRGSSAKVCR